MRRALMILLSVLSVWLTACGQREQSPVAPSDAVLQKRLVGTWAKETTLDDGANRRCFEVYRADGTFVWEATIVRSNKTSRASDEGIFFVRDGALTVTLTKHNGTNTAEPDTHRMRIVRVDDRELAVIWDERPDVGVVTIRRQTTP